MRVRLVQPSRLCGRSGRSSRPRHRGRLCAASERALLRSPAASGEAAVGTAKMDDETKDLRRVRCRFFWITSIFAVLASILPFWLPHGSFSSGKATDRLCIPLELFKLLDFCASNFRDGIKRERRTFRWWPVPDDKIAK